MAESFENPKVYSFTKSKLITDKFATLLHDYNKIVGHFMFTVDLANRSDKVFEIVTNALEKTENHKIQNTDKNENSLHSRKKASEFLNEFSWVNNRNLVTSILEIFLWYLAHIVYEALKRDEKLLKSGETVKVDEILEFKNRKEMLEYLANKKTTQLSFGGMKKLERFFKERIKIKIFDNQKQKDQLIIFNEIRNIYVHNRGYVNEIFLSRVSNSCGYSFKKNERFWIGIDVLELATNALEVAEKIDMQMSRKFKITKHSYEYWRKKNKW